MDDNLDEFLTPEGEEFKKYLLRNYYSSPLSKISFAQNYQDGRDFSIKSKIDNLPKSVRDIIREHSITNFSDPKLHQHINNKLETQFLIRVIDFEGILKLMKEHLKKNFNKDKIEEIRRSFRKTARLKPKNFRIESQRLRNMIEIIRYQIDLKNYYKHQINIVESIIDYKHLLKKNQYEIDFKRLTHDKDLKNYKEPISEEDKEKLLIADIKFSAFISDNRPKELLAEFLNRVAFDNLLKFVKDYMEENVSRIMAKGKKQTKKAKRPTKKRKPISNKR